MGLHHESNHGRVFRGLEAQDHVEMHKRGYRGATGDIVMHIPEHYAKAAARPANTGIAKYLTTSTTTSPDAAITIADKEAVSTVDSVVYVTLSADFTGSVAGYTTLSEAATPTSAQSAVSAASSSAAVQSSATSSEAASSTVTSASTVIVSPTSSSSSSVNNKSRFLNAPSTATAATTSSAAVTALVGGGVTTSRTSATAATVAAGTPISATRTADISETSHDLSGGAKAGLALGILLALALAGGLLFFCWRRRKNPNNREELFDEKHASSIFGGKAASTRDNRNSAASDRSTRSAATAPRLSLRPVTQFLPSLTSNRNSAGNTLDVAAAAMSEKPKSMWERRAVSSQNPFDDDAVVSEKQDAPTNPFDEPEANADEPRKSFHTAHTQKTSLDGSEPTTPKSLKFGTASAVAVAAAGTASAVPPMPKGPNNVHRVQLDFKPSMEDELELTSGQLVRMLHEYDDGWALCIRMDRSQQGVCPRTCLSKLPVKPRQSPPPAAKNSRPTTPQGPNAMVPSPLTPSQSAGSEQEQSQTVPARKPVPGQAE